MLASGPAVTTSVAVAEIPPLVAVTVFANVPVTPPAVSIPDVLIDPPPATTDQVGVTVTVAPAASVPTATNCCVPFTASVLGFGEIEMAASVPGALMP